MRVHNPIHSPTDIERIAIRLLREHDCLDLPIAIEKLASSMGLRVEAADLGEDVSGVLVVEQGRGTIGYNRGQARVRQRFTIAHEIGHYELHRQNHELFIDKGFKVFRRDQGSATGEHAKEREANAFGAALLMPAPLVHEAIRGLEYDLGDEAALDELAETFQVSRQAMSHRLDNLRIFEEYELD